MSEREQSIPARRTDIDRSGLLPRRLFPPDLIQLAVFAVGVSDGAQSRISAAENRRIDRLAILTQLFRRRG
jgi:hypothetical protein